MSARPTQRDRLLRILRDAGAAGVHTHELRHEGFGNPSQRVRELADRGHEIECKRERRNDSPGTRYTLKTAGGQGSASFHDADPARDHTPPSGEVAPPSADHEPTSLFGDAGERNGAINTRSPYDAFEDAA